MIDECLERLETIRLKEADHEKKPEIPKINKITVGEKTKIHWKSF